MYIVLIHKCHHIFRIQLLTEIWNGLEIDFRSVYLVLGGLETKPQCEGKPTPSASHLSALLLTLDKWLWVGIWPPISSFDLLPHFVYTYIFFPFVCPSSVSELRLILSEMDVKSEMCWGWLSEMSGNCSTSNRKPQTVPKLHAMDELLPLVIFRYLLPVGQYSNSYLIWSISNNFHFIQGITYFRFMVLIIHFTCIKWI